MFDRHASGWLAFSAALSTVALAARGFGDAVVVHWSASGRPNLVLPAWAAAASFPVTLAPLMVLLARTRSRRLIGGTRSRTIAFVAALVVSAQTYVLFWQPGLWLDPRRFCAVVIGLSLAFTGNFWAKTAPDSSPPPGGRRSAAWMFATGLLLAAVGAVLPPLPS